MKNKLPVLYLIIVSCLVACFGLASCSHSEDQTALDFNLWCSYQIGNSSMQDVVLYFHKNEEPMAVYVEIYNQSDPIFVSQENATKEISTLIHTDRLPLKAGQMALFYKEIVTQTDETPKASCLSHFGYGNGYFNLSNVGIPIIGNRIVMSIDGQTDSILPVQKRELWETWYDEKSRTYYHFWRIE
ncbi:MAG: hypothetical protein IKD12_03050 [Paludibacteraceae bacterium]|nr:hypothetical protein [Paludibacteraceae bacterium]